MVVAIAGDDATIGSESSKRSQRNASRSANLVVGALTVGQFVGEQPPSVRLILFGAFSWVFLVAGGIFLAGGRNDG